MKKLCEPVNEAELIVIKSLLDSEGAYYFVQGDNFGSLEVGPRIGHYNAKAVRVPDDQYAWAVKVLGSEIRESKNTDSEPHYSLWDHDSDDPGVRVYWMVHARSNAGKRKKGAPPPGLYEMTGVYPAGSPVSL